MRRAERWAYATAARNEEAAAASYFTLMRPNGLDCDFDTCAGEP